MKLKLNLNLFKSAKAMVELVEQEKAAIDLINTLSGIEKEIKLEQKWERKFQDIVHEMIANATRELNCEPILIKEHINKSPDVGFHEQITISIFLEEGQRILFLIKMNCTKSYLDIIRESMYQKILQGLVINGIVFYINRNKPIARYDQIDRPEYNFTKEINFDI